MQQVSLDIHTSTYFKYCTRTNCIIRKNFIYLLFGSIYFFAGYNFFSQITIKKIYEKRLLFSLLNIGEIILYKIRSMKLRFLMLFFFIF